jgi:cell division protease FtsH
MMSDKEKKITAYHEAGHAVVAHMLPEADPIQKVSIISRGRTGGFTMKTPTEDKSYHTLNEFKSDLAVMLAGQIAEREVFNEISTGASNDLKQATSLARQIVTRYGMSKLGPRTFGAQEEMIFLGREIHEQRDYSEKIAQDIDQEINHLLTEAQTTATKIISKQRDSLNRIAEELLVKETIERDVFEKMLGPKPAGSLGA